MSRTIGCRKGKAAGVTYKLVMMAMLGGVGQDSVGPGMRLEGAWVRALPTWWMEGRFFPVLFRSHELHRLHGVAGINTPLVPQGQRRRASVSGQVPAKREPDPIAGAGDSAGLNQRRNEFLRREPPMMVQRAPGSTGPGIMGLLLISL